MARAYFLTFRTYGTWLPGDPRGTVNRLRRGRGESLVPGSISLALRARSLLRRPAVVMTRRQRPIVHNAMVECCAWYGWELHALNVRSNHVHALVTADVPPELAMTRLKVRATRELVRVGEFQRGDRVWARHGSTRHIFGERGFLAAWTYITHGQ